MKINTILKKINIPIVKFNHSVTSITDDSRECIFNSVFIACDGSRDDGRKYINSAISAGAKTIISDLDVLEYPNINYIRVNNPKRILALMLRIFYKDISKKLNLIGIIGTNGKTTTSTLAYNLFNYVGRESMLIGSNGIFYQDERIKINNTTPGITIIYEYLLKAKHLGIDYVFMEVSSISISELRCLGLDFKVLIFTNFSEDHLDYHKTMSSYLEAKKIPFIKLNDKSYAIVNSDDISSKEVTKYVTSIVYTYGINSGEYQAKPTKYGIDGISFIYNDYIYKTNLLGKFNVYNCISLLPLCKIYHISDFEYRNFLTQFRSVDGRMNLIKYKQSSIIIDYAHTEEAVRNAVEEVLKITKGKLWIIIGCGGNREKEKRYHIGKYLDNIKANIILTSDNPRYEDPVSIIDDIKKGMKRDVDVCVNRQEAIIYGLENLNRNDCLLILGKGSEDYIEINGVKYKYSDMEVCNEWIKSH